MNPDRLELARKRRGLNKSAMAALLGVDAKTYRSYEGGLSTPSKETMARISQSLRFPVEFFEDERHIEAPIEDHVSFRSMRSLSATKRDMALAQGALAMHLNLWLKGHFELPAPSLPDLRYAGDPQSAAASLREHWGLGELSIRNMVHLLESRGVRVYALSVEAREVDAFSMWLDGEPYVFLNTRKSAEHSRFDAAHELAHLVLHKHGDIRDREPEYQANQFASAFLMPRRSLLATAPRNPGLDDLVGYKQNWGVSVAALNYRLHSLGITTDWQHRTLCVRLSEKGYRTREPDPIPHESSLVLPQLFANLYEEKGLTRSHIAAELRISSNELEQLVFGLVLGKIDGKRIGSQKLPQDRPSLTLVK